MPMLDVGFMTQDPLLADTFNVRRRLDIVGSNGRVNALPDYLNTDVVGTVTQDDPSELIRTEDGQNVPKRIFIASPFQFIAASPGRQPDEVTWNGVVYTVLHSLPYSRYGTGFYEAICEFRGTIPPVQ